MIQPAAATFVSVADVAEPEGVCMSTCHERPPLARSRQADELLLRRIVAHLVRAGWSEVGYWGDIDEDDSEFERSISLEFERSGFFLSVDWEPSARRLSLGDGTEAREWEDDLPPLSALAERVTIELPTEGSEAACVELARRSLAACGLLDATRVIVPEGSPFHFGKLTRLLFAWYVYGAAERYRGTDTEDEWAALETLGTEVGFELAAGLRRYPIIVPDPVPRIAGLGIAEWCWRRESDVEDWHHKVDDLTMARANIAATRAVWPHVHLVGVDWPAVRLALTARARRLADGRLLADLFAEGWGLILASIHREIDLWERIEDQIGPEAVLRMLTLHGSRTASVGSWWGSGSYETLARAALSEALETDAVPATIAAFDGDRVNLVDQLVYAPDLLDDDALGWLINTVLDHESQRRHESQQSEAAVTLQDWEVDAFAEILELDDKEQA